MNVEEKRSIRYNFIPPEYKTADTSITYLHPGMSLRHVVPIADPEGNQLELAVRDTKNYFFNVWASMHTSCEYYTLHSDPVVIGKNANYGPSVISLNFMDTVTNKEFVVLKIIEILEEGVYLEYSRKKIIKEQVFDQKECHTEHNSANQGNSSASYNSTDSYASSSYDNYNYTYDYDQIYSSDLYAGGVDQNYDEIYQYDEAGSEISNSTYDDYDQQAFDDQYFDDQNNDYGDYNDTWLDDKWLDFEWNDDEWNDDEYYDDEWYDDGWYDDGLDQDFDGNNSGGTTSSNSGSQNS